MDVEPFGGQPLAIRPPLFEESLLRRIWSAEYDRFSVSERSSELESMLRRWLVRGNLMETQLESQFINLFFTRTWDYIGPGISPDGRYTFLQQQGVAGAGQRGGMGSADLAMGHYGPGADGVNQVLCEFKDTRSGLDVRQNRPGSRRTPVEQGLDYLNCEYQNRNREARVVPSWAIITDMNEFRLYHRRGASQFQRFIVRASTSEDLDYALLPPEAADEAEAEACAFRRFVFSKLFNASMLLASVEESEAETLMHRQDIHEKEIEESFYRDYRDYRASLYRAILESNPGFPGTRGRLVRLTQRLLDRFIFLLYCEDMGDRLDFPPDQLRTILTEYANHRFYDPVSQEPWNNLKSLFATMREGGIFDDHRINRFNGGLFEEDPELEGLNIPAQVFCTRNPGTPGAIAADRNTLLYFSASYNFGIRSETHSKTIGLTTLGRIFEQSITELEIMEAHEDRRVSLNELGRRRTDGVYYTPEWVTGAIVEEVIGGRLEDIRTELGYQDLPELTEGDVTAYRSFLADRRLRAPVAAEWISFLDNYKLRLDRLKIVDPACGSGAFLIQALDRLVSEYRSVIAEKQRITGRVDFFDREEIIRSILSHNLYGVDINSESVEITQLALWLHTASPGTPLCSLDANIKCGNSLIGSNFYDDPQMSLLGPEERERVNIFDWERAFPGIFSRGGFDCVIGNPPYIKYQNLRRVHPGVAEYLRNKRRDDGTPLYRSTRSQNFDIYLAFIEKGLNLLGTGGRMGFIAPNLWLVNDYGRDLRAFLSESRQLSRWVDFKAFQVFRDAITYTALQFFRAEPQDVIECIFAHDGPPTVLDWSGSDRVRYDEIRDAETWNFMPIDERRLIGRLSDSCTRLDESCSGIFVGVQTTLNSVYHLTRLGDGRYLTELGEEVCLEDSLLHPLMSGGNTKRYEIPRTSKYVIFPYKADGRLFSEVEMRDNFPNAWQYLSQFRFELQAKYPINRRNEWWGYRYPKNIVKQQTGKLCIAETVPSLQVTVDRTGRFCLDNVRVNGILVEDENWMLFLLGVLNAPVCDFVFRRIAKPKEGGFFEANKQFIAPLPIPNASEEQKQFVAEKAGRLLDLHTRRRDTLEAVAARLRSGQVRLLVHTPDWIWADVGTIVRLRNEAPRGLSRAEKTAWAKRIFHERLSAHLMGIDGLISERRRTSIRVISAEDRVTLSINDRTIVEVFDRPYPDFIAAQWRLALREFKGDASDLLKRILHVAESDDAGLMNRIIGLDREVTALDERITAEEHEMNDRIFGLYDLSPDERRLVEADLPSGPNEVIVED